MPVLVQDRNLTDVELVERAQRGDEQSFNELFHRYDSKISTYLVRMVGEDGRDLAHETFVRAWRMLGTLQGEKKFEAWLYRIATNQAKDYLRRRRLIQFIHWEEHAQAINEPAFSMAGPEEKIVNQEFLKFAATQIPLKYWQCVILQIVEERSQREIATLLGINERSVSTYVRRGLEKLRQLYLSEEKIVKASRRRQVS